MHDWAINQTISSGVHSCQRLAWLNEVVAIGAMTRDGDELTINLHRVIA